MLYQEPSMQQNLGHINLQFAKDVPGDSPKDSSLESRQISEQLSSKEASPLEKIEAIDIELDNAFYQQCLFSSVMIFSLLFFEDIKEMNWDRLPLSTLLKISSWHISHITLVLLELLAMRRRNLRMMTVVAFLTAFFTIPILSIVILYVNQFGPRHFRGSGCVIYPFPFMLLHFCMILYLINCLIIWSGIAWMRRTLEQRKYLEGLL